MIDNLEDAIAHCHEKAEENRKKADEWYAGGCSFAQAEGNECLECAKDHEQLAKWLTELQERRKADRWIPVSERLPNTNGVYNVAKKLTEGGTIYVISTACYFDGQNTWHDDNRVNHGRPYPDVIAWRPLKEI